MSRRSHEKQIPHRRPQGDRVRDDSHSGFYYRADTPLKTKRPPRTAAPDVIPNQANVWRWWGRLAQLGAGTGVWFRGSAARCAPHGVAGGDTGVAHEAAPLGAADWAETGLFGRCGRGETEHPQRAMGKGKEKADPSPAFAESGRPGSG